MSDRKSGGIRTNVIFGAFLIVLLAAFALLLDAGNARRNEQRVIPPDEVASSPPGSRIEAERGGSSLSQPLPAYPGPAGPPSVATRPAQPLPPYPAPVEPLSGVTRSSLPGLVALPTPTPLPPPGPPIAVPNYTPQEVIVAKVGSGTGEIGITHYRGSPPDGPQSFDVDERGNIYILDQANKRVNRYDANGRFVGGFSFPDAVAPMGIAVWKDGTVFLADERDQTVKKFDEGGRLLLAYNTAPGASESGRVEFQADGVRIDRAGNVYAIGMGGLAQLVAAEVGTVQAVHLREAMSDKVKPDTALKEGRISGRFVREDKTLTGYIEMTRATGQKHVLRINIGELPVAGYPLEMTADGAIYARVSTQVVPGRDGYNRWVMKFDKSSSIVGAALLPSNFYTSTRRSALVDEMGRIYYMQVLKDSIHVFRWETR